MTADSATDEGRILAFVYARHRRFRAGLANRMDVARQIDAKKHWRTMHYRTPPAYLWEVLARVFGQRLNPRAYLHSRNLVRRHSASTGDVARAGARLAGRSHALRFELSQRYGLFPRLSPDVSARLDRALEVLVTEGLAVVDRPVIFLTARGAQAASAHKSATP